MTARTAAAPRTDLAACGRRPTGVVDLMAFRFDFERLMERHGVRLDFSQVPTLAMLPALLGLTLVSHGAEVDMPQSTHELYRELRAALEGVR